MSTVPKRRARSRPARLRPAPPRPRAISAGQLDPPQPVPPTRLLRRGMTISRAVQAPLPAPDPSLPAHHPACAPPAAPASTFTSTSPSTSTSAQHAAPPVAPSAAPSAAAATHRPAPAGPRQPPSAYDASRAARVSRTGIVERSVAAAVISAARQRGLTRKPRAAAAPADAAAAAAAAAAADATAAPLPPHHRRLGGFCNPWESALKENGLRTRGSGSRTFFHKVAKDRRPPDEQLATMVLLASRPQFDRAAAELARDKYALVSFWIGHSTFFINARGLTVLTDPVWSARLGPLGPRRLVPPPCEIADLPPVVDVVVLSSACYDHYDKNAVAELAGRVGVWLVPLGVKALLVGVGVPEEKVVQLDWWQEHRVNGSLFACTPAQHYSVRDEALWCSWVIHAPHHRVFYCGATGYRPVQSGMEDSDLLEHRVRFGGPFCPAFKDISRKYGSCDTAFLPIGGFKPRALVSGVQGDAVDMLCVHKDLRARRTVVHRWGTFACNDEGMLDAVRALEAGLMNSPIAEHEVTYVRHGGLHVT